MKMEETIAEIKSTLSSWEDARKTLDQEVASNKEKICDMYHMIEFKNLNAAEGFKAYKKFQELLQERRRIKDSIEYINSICPEMESIKTAFEELDSRDRKYHPRSNEALFTYENADQVCPSYKEEEMIRAFKSVDKAAEEVMKSWGYQEFQLPSIKKGIRGIISGTKTNKNFCGWIWTQEGNMIVATRPSAAARKFA